MKIIPVILSGGVGSRLWPLSREHFPKQCLPLTDTEYSLLQQTLLRTVSLDVADPIVVCNEDHRFLIAQQLQSIGVTKSSIVLEPKGRNTAPAIALAAFQALERDPEATLVVLPADHVMKNTEAFRASVQEAIIQSKSDLLVTFGIKPTYPETGYGYIEAAATDVTSAVVAFREKPDADTAARYLAAGNYFWNSGMFVFKARVFLEELKQFQPAIYEATQAAMVNRQSPVESTMEISSWESLHGLALPLPGRVDLAPSSAKAWARGVAKAAAPAAAAAPPPPRPHRNGLSICANKATRRMLTHTFIRQFGLRWPPKSFL